MIVSTHGIITSITSAVAYDSDAVAFFTATGITDDAIKDAVNNLVVSIKAASLWSRFIAIYPLVGGTATTHKFNLKNPLDTDAAFRLTFSGGITHNANGVTGNGTNGFADTRIIPSTHFTQDNASGFAYIRTNAQGAFVDFGVLEAASPLKRFQQNARNASNLHATGLNDNSVSGTANSDSRGMFGISRRSSGSYSQSFNTTQTTISVTSTGLSTGRLTLMAQYQAGSILNYSPREYAFFCFGEGITDSEADTLYAIVQDFQTELSRQV